MMKELAFATALLVSTAAFAEDVCALKDGDGAVVNLIVCPTGSYEVPAGLTMNYANDVDRSWGQPALPPSATHDPRPLSRIEFIGLVQQVGSLSDDQLVASKADGRLDAFWLRLSLADAIQRDHPLTVAGLQKLVDTGYLTTQQVALINSAWPTN